MAHHNTVFRQLLDLLPRHEFDTEARQHQKGQRLRVRSRWMQFVALGLGQLAGLQSLNDMYSFSGSIRAEISLKGQGSWSRPEVGSADALGSLRLRRPPAA